MKATITNGTLSLELGEILEQLSAEELAELSDSLGCQSAVIKAVTEQILDGRTELGSHGYTGEARPEPVYGLDWARREIAKRAGDVAAKEIERLQSALLRSEQRADDLAKEMCRLRSAARILPSGF